MPEPIAQGVIVTRPAREAETLAVLAREMSSILRALQAPAEVAGGIPPSADYVALAIEPPFQPDGMQLPDLTDRAATVVALARDAPEGRAALALARKTLRGAGAALGARELLFTPEDFGVLGLESDTLRERLEILLRTLALDAERLRLKREGWEEPE